MCRQKTKCAKCAVGFQGDAQRSAALRRRHFTVINFNRSRVFKYSTKLSIGDAFCRFCKTACCKQWFFVSLSGLVCQQDLIFAKQGKIFLFFFPALEKQALLQTSACVSACAVCKCACLCVGLSKFHSLYSYCI